MRTKTRPQPAAVPAAPTAVAAVAEPAAAAKPRSAWYRDRAGGALFGCGLGVLGVGTGLWAAANLDIAAANRSATFDQFVSHRGGAEPRQIAGIVSVGVGGVLVAGAIIRYAIASRARPRASAYARSNLKGAR